MEGSSHEPSLQDRSIYLYTHIVVVGVVVVIAIVIVIGMFVMKISFPFSVIFIQRDLWSGGSSRRPGSENRVLGWQGSCV